MSGNSAAIERLVAALKAKTNIVPIVGAGVSINSGVPGGNYLRERMRQTLLSGLCETTKFNQMFDKDADMVRRSLRRPSSAKPPLEEVLSIYSKVEGPEVLHAWLLNHIQPASDRTQPPYLPSFTHEYSAHLVSCGFLKYFITANFDEILETTIEDEVGRTAFQVVASNSEFERLQNKTRAKWDLEFGDVPPKCYLFKPHGTISRYLTLRHLPDRVSSFGTDKTTVLKKVLEDSLLLFLGFGNYNEDYWLLFGETYCAGLTDDIIIVDKTPEPVRKNLHSGGGKKVYTFKGTTDCFFKELAKRLHRPGEPFGRHRQKPTRHEIRALFFDLFSRRLAKIEDENEYYKIKKALYILPRPWFYERIYELELLIYLFKTRGLFVDLSTSDCSRIKEAFRRCFQNLHDRRTTKVQDLRPYTVLATMAQ